jgi:hypothetical protein
LEYGDAAVIPPFIPLIDVIIGAPGADPVGGVSVSGWGGPPVSAVILYEPYKPCVSASDVVVMGCAGINSVVVVSSGSSVAIPTFF